MARIKKPLRHTLAYLASLLGVVSILLGRLSLFDNSQNTFSQLEIKAKKVFGSVLLIPAVKADVPGCGGDGGGDDDFTADDSVCSDTSCDIGGDFGGDFGGGDFGSDSAT